MRPYIGERLREVRTRRNMSQETLAQRAAITQTHLSRLERDVSAPRYSTIFRLARELDVTPEYLTGLEFTDLEDE